jgi:hypothetical protein
MKIITLRPDSEHLHGATLAQRHLTVVQNEFSSLDGEPALFVLDLSDAKSVTGSYLRATVLWALLCGRADAANESTNGHVEKWAVRPLPIFPSIIAKSPELLDDVDDFFRVRNLPILLTLSHNKNGLTSARLLGSLDSFLVSTLTRLVRQKQATAAELADASQEAITVNAWSNRLADLHSLRLVTRERSGKFWRYEPLAKEITLWA